MRAFAGGLAILFLLACFLLACTAEPPSTPDASTLPACSQGTFQLTESPPAILFLLQRSGSMALENKWAFAAKAIVDAVDLPAFDDAALGLLVAPSDTVMGPQCTGGAPVACGLPAYAQTPLRLAGTARSSDPGVRQDMAAWLAANAPDMFAGDGNPLYVAVRSGIGILQSLDVASKRLLFVVTDGQISCTSLSTRSAFKDGNGCLDWEDPQNLVELVRRAHDDSRAPVETFVVGVPGSNTYDPTGIKFPPYRMRAALSAIAKAGAPGFVPANCDAASPFVPTAPDPTTSCHVDLTQAGTYSSQAVADAIGRVRSSGTRCIFSLPAQHAVDPAKVNVSYGSTPIARRADPMQACAACWDFTTANGVELLGAACDAVHAGAKVTALLGCPTDVR